MMKKVLLSSVATIATVSAFSAFAADLPSRKAAPVYAPPPPMWTGFYAGLNAGYGFGTNNNSISNVTGLPVNIIQTDGSNVNNKVGSYASGLNPLGFALASNQSLTQSGFIGGGQIGYNYQYGSNFVVGIEADIQGAGIGGTGYGTGASASGPVNYAGTGTTTGNNYYYQSAAVGGTEVDANVNWLGTVRGRIGYLATPTMLLYGTGGLAYGGVSAKVYQNAGVTQNAFYTVNGGSPVAKNKLYVPPSMSYAGNSRQSQTLVGWTAGGGVEWMFMPNWSLKAEAIYWNLGNQNVSAAAYGPTGVYFQKDATKSWAFSPNLGAGNVRVNYQGVIARAGVNYHFNWGAAPVVAAY